MIEFAPMAFRLIRRLAEGCARLGLDRPSIWLFVLSYRIAGYAAARREEPPK